MPPQQTVKFLDLSIRFERAAIARIEIGDLMLGEVTQLNLQAHIKRRLVGIVDEEMRLSRVTDYLAQVRPWPHGIDLPIVVPRPKQAEYLGSIRAVEQAIHFIEAPDDRHRDLAEDLIDQEILEVDVGSTAFFQNRQ